MRYSSETGDGSRASSGVVGGAAYVKAVPNRADTRPTASTPHQCERQSGLLALVSGAGSASLHRARQPRRRLGMGADHGFIADHN